MNINAAPSSVSGPWPDMLAAALDTHERAVLVTVADARGSTPRERGAAMVVTSDGITGTIGGGHLEHEAMRLAREALAGSGDDATPAATWLVRFPLAARLGQCCGGVATLAFQTIARDDAGWLATAQACQRTAASFVLAATVGRGAARLLVTADDARGTLTDPALDSAAVAAARERLASGKSSRDNSGTGALTISGTTLLLHVVHPVDFNVIVFGNGHVGRALVQVLGALPAVVTWVDEREGDFPATVPTNVEIVATDAPEAEIRAAPAGSYVVIATHSHALDFDLATTALLRADWRYLGMIGSSAKRAQLERRAAQRGLPPDAAARVVCPIGATLAHLRSKEPGAIAVAVAAEMLAVRERGEVGVRPHLSTPGQRVTKNGG